MAPRRWVASLPARVFLTIGIKEGVEMKSESNKRPATAEIEMLTNGMADVILRENVTEQNNNGEIL